MSNQPHFFIAIPTSNEIRHLLKDWTSQLQQKLNFKSWVHPEDYHITLSFLGGSSFQQINEVKQGLTPVIQKHKPFSLQVSGLGTFGTSDRPRILWSGVNSDDQLYSLQKDIHETCEKLGYKLDRRSYTPHITLARRWNADTSFPEHELKKMIQPKNEVGSWDVTHVVLYQTHINRIPKYQALKLFKLGDS